MLLILRFLTGGMISSFLVTQINATLQGKSNLVRSTCWECGHELSVIDLLPLFGYLIRRGKCKYCETKISPQYPMYELLYGIITITGQYFLLVIVILMTIVLESTVPIQKEEVLDDKTGD